MSISVVDYGVCNIGALCNMLRRIGIEVKIAKNPEDILIAEKIILPGIGAFDQGMKELFSRGLVDPIKKKCLDSSTAILGICLGMQLLGESSEESNIKSKGLGLIPGKSIRFQFPKDLNLAIPHIGWNSIIPKSYSPIIESFDPLARFYFVHSYHFICKDNKYQITTSNYGYEFSSIIGKNKILGTQFHPEKSHRYGFKLLRNFAENY